MTLRNHYIRPPESVNTFDARETLAELHRLGVHFVRFNARSKVPFDKAHRDRPLSLEATLRTHDDPTLTVGWIPAHSAGLWTVVDVDTGDPTHLMNEHPPAFAAPSRTPGRVHLNQSQGGMCIC